MKYLLREMSIDDISSVMEGEEKTFGETNGYDFLYQELTLNPFAHYIVLEIDKKVRGYISFWITEQAEIVNFYIDEDYRGYHFGDMMLELVMEVCKSSGIKYLSLEVREKNIIAKNLYKKHGFKENHVREHYYKDGENAILMIKEFGDEL